jgi:hypothetical protein
MPALLMTAAEIAAAEAAAAQILAAQQAAAVAQAAQVAQATQAAQAAQAATTATQAATQAGTQAAAQAGTQAATQASTSGIQALAQEVGAAVQPTGIETLTTQAELEQMRQAASGAQNLAQQPVNFLNNSYAGEVTTLPTDMSSITSAPDMSVKPVSHFDVRNPAASFDASRFAPSETLVQPTADFSAGTGETLGRGTYASAPTAPTASNTALDYGFKRPDYLGGGQGVSPLGRNATSLQTTQPAFTDVGASVEGVVRPGFELTSQYVEPSAASSNLPAQPATGLQGLLDKGIAYAKDNPIQVGLGAMSVYNMLNRPEPYKKPKYQSTFNAGAYRGYEPTPPTPYTPQYAQYAQGGLADLGGYSDYARGGRMLKGPGDGMSDDIPATIANKQPARLANEEFVVPADVVSHLGNGSSEAGAKALYKMMDRVRQARTGNKKQGKQINPEKYLA